VSIKLPSEAADLLDEIERSNWPESTKLRLLAAGFKQGSPEVDRLRAGLRDELLACAHDVFDWCRQLVNDPGTTRIWEVLGQKSRLMIYWGKYFNGKPVPATDVASRARLTVGRVVGPDGQAVPILWYEEQYKWFPPHAHEIRDAEMFVNSVHPRFLKKLREHLDGPHCWRWVIQDLRRRTPRKK